MGMTPQEKAERDSLRRAKETEAASGDNIGKPGLTERLKAGDPTTSDHGRIGAWGDRQGNPTDDGPDGPTTSSKGTYVAIAILAVALIAILAVILL